MFRLFLLAFLLTAKAVVYGALSEGEGLEQQMWVDIKAHNWVSVQAHVAPFFQAVAKGGVLTKDSQIQQFKGMQVGNFTISDLKATGGLANTIVITYKIAISETADGDPNSAEPSYRMSVWQNMNGKWQWIAHATN